MVARLGFKPTRGADTRWLSLLNVCVDIRRGLDTLVQMKQDPRWATRMGKTVVDAINKLNGLRNELSVCISILELFEEPVIALQVCSIATMLRTVRYGTGGGSVRYGSTARLGVR